MATITSTCKAIQGLTLSGRKLTISLIATLRGNNIERKDAQQWLTERIVVESQRKGAKCRPLPAGFTYNEGVQQGLNAFLGLQKFMTDLKKNYDTEYFEIVRASKKVFSVNQPAIKTIITRTGKEDKNSGTVSSLRLPEEGWQKGTADTPSQTPEKSFPVASKGMTPEEAFSQTEKMGIITTAMEILSKTFGKEDLQKIEQFIANL